MIHWLKSRQLHSKDAAVRRKAIQQLGESPTPPPLALLRAALADEDDQVRRLAVGAVARSEDPDRLEVLLVALQDRDPEVLQTAVGALRKFSDARIPAALVPLLFHAEAGVRGRAAQALEALGWKPAGRDQEIGFAVARNQLAHAASFGPAALPALEGVLQRGPYNLRVAAIEAIASIDDKRALRPLLAALKSPDPTVCSAATEALGQIGDPECIPSILGLVKHPAAQVRASAVDVLGRLNATAALEAIRERLRDPDWQVRRASVGALGRLKDKAGAATLAQNLEDPDPDVREAAALALGNVRDRAAIGSLVKALKDANSSVRRIAAASLSRIDENWSTSPEAQAAITELKAGLEDKDPQRRHLVGRLLTSLGHQPAGAEAPAGEELTVTSLEKRRKLAISLFLAVLEDEDRDLRRAAAECLGRMGDKHAHSPLMRALGDSDESVRLSVEQALQAIEAQHAAG